MLGVPLGAGPAHVVKLGAVGIEQRFREALEEVEDIGSQAWRLPAMSYAGFWVTRRSGGVVCRHLDDLDAVLEFDACDDLRQVICTFESPPGL